MRVLYLSAWYPTDKDQMAGLFVKKHADAVRAQGVDVRVWKYEQIEKGWQPDLIQLNVLSLKNALLTYLLHLRYRVPYVIVEHWSRYLPQHRTFPKGIEGAILRFVAKRASCIMPVSECLKQAMQDCGIKNKHWQVINNVVDDFFYRRRADGEPTGVRLLHVSCFDEQAKNTMGLLRAFRAAQQLRPNIHLTMVGAGINWQQSKDYAAEIGLNEEQVRWTGELTPKGVCHEMQQADCFLLFSNYENAPVVLSESLAVGCPIISTRVGGIPEMVNEECGILVPAGDEKALLNAIQTVIDHPERYTAEQIRPYGLRYTYEHVARQLIAIYESAIVHAVPFERITL